MKFITKIIPLLLACMLAFGKQATSQDEGIIYNDHVYLEGIRTVKFHVDGLLVRLPMIDLGNPASLLLSWDDMGSEAKNYVFTVQHCDANWKPSTGVTEMDYLTGFSEGQVRNYDFSFKVKSNYVHYWLSLPNEDFRITLSGNYLLKVYEDEDEERLAITRRFMVVDNRVNTSARTVRPARVDRMRTHQEIDFTVFHESFEIRNPQQELSATVLQNGRWDNAYSGIRPMFSKPGEQIFDFQDRIVFPAGKEFRYLDLRGVQYPSARILEMTLDEETDEYRAVLDQDKKRGSMPYFEWRDINGNFIIENSDERGRIRSAAVNQRPAGDFITQLSEQEEQEYQARLAQARSPEERASIQLDRQERINYLRQDANQREIDLYGENTFADDVHSLQSEYIDVRLQLYSPGEMDGQEVYIFGGLSDWQLKPEFKMAYNPATNGYVAKLRLKQGYYDYVYAAYDPATKTLDFEETEGDWHETENNYTILLYYRPFGARYDQLIGSYALNSRD